MKKIVLFILASMFILSGCSMENTNTQYFGDYETEPVYQRIVNIENCIVPQELQAQLEDIYGEKITCISLEYDAQSKTFKSPYEDFEFNVMSIYSSTKNKGKVASDAFAFFKEYSEVPLFIMDSEGSYIVDRYEVVTIDENKHIHKVDAWVSTDLYLCLHKYAACDGDELRRKAYSNIVKSMADYVDFENRLSTGADK